MRYALAPNPAFWTIQGEGHLRGHQMAFVRLAGCSVGCDGCDTNYRVTSRATAGQIVDRVRAVSPEGYRGWVWLTGGEPTDQDLTELTDSLANAGYHTAIATSGVRPVGAIMYRWLSVSPHSIDHFGQRGANELKLVDGLNGLNLDAWVDRWRSNSDWFKYRFVQPMSINGVEDRASLERCLEFLKRHPDWLLSRQDHHHWKVP